MNRIAINKAHYPVTTLGHGKRIGIWMQGCSIRCKGCVSMDTWETPESTRIPITQLLTWCKQFEDQELDGITISGGEPFEQPQALADLLAALRAWATALPRPMDILCYSGLPYKTLHARHHDILALLDVVIPEPFVSAHPVAPLCGSDNQRIVPLSPLGHERYDNAPVAVPGKHMQMAVENGQIWFIGIPQRGDMERLEQLCRNKGLEIGANSWRT